MARRPQAAKRVRRDSSSQLPVRMRIRRPTRRAAARAAPRAPALSPRPAPPRRPLRYHTAWVLWIPFGMVAILVRFWLLGFYFCFLRYVLPKDCRSLWWWITWGVTCFYQVWGRVGTRGDAWRAPHGRARVRAPRPGRPTFPGAAPRAQTPCAGRAPCPRAPSHAALLRQRSRNDHRRRGTWLTTATATSMTPKTLCSRRRTRCADV